MSRRPPNPAAERAAQNQQTIKSLLKLEPNKICADCKRNKHPRWASWNLGVFICIRCSGIHRGMGTHISRVKSVDLDSWTDEQLQSILSWGNARANKYWEAKLAAGHVPSEAKIENFIRTKYELKRWVMDGPIPDPATLDVDGDDDIPLSLVKEKQTLDRKESIRKASVGRSGAPAGHPQAAAAGSSAPVIDLIGGGVATVSSTPPPRASTAGPTAARVPPKGEPAPPKATTNNTKDSLLGLDFLGSQPAAPARPSSTTGTSGVGAGGQSRPDLKQSILSLYATAPRAQQQQPQTTGGSFGGMPSPGFSQTSGGGGGSGGLVDAFSSLSFSPPAATTTSPKPADAFSGLSSLTSTTSRSPAPPTASSSAFSGLSGGSFFDAKPAAAQPAKPTSKPQSSALGGLGGFDAFSSPSPAAAASAAPPPAAAASSNAFGDLFDFTSPSPAATTTAPQPTSSFSPPPGAPSASVNSVFNLSSPVNQPAKPAASTTAAAPTSPLAAVSANWSNADVWANDAWGAPDSSAAAAAATAAPTSSSSISAPPLTSSSSAFSSTGLGKATTTNDFGWGSAAGAGSTTGGSFASQSIVPGASGGFNPTPKVTADEEFGGWSSSTPGTGNGNAKAAGGFGASEDLFSNVWD